MRYATVVLVMLATACSGKNGPASAASDCSDQMRELKQYILAANDPSHPQIAVPFRTGDAARDHRIDELRARYREKLRPVDPSKPLTPLSADAQPGPLETELAPCAAARAQLSRFGDSTPGRRLEAMADIADAIGSCGCNVDVPLVRAMFYLDARGPD